MGFATRSDAEPFQPAHGGEAVTRLLGWRLLRGSLAQLVLCSLLWVAPAHLPAQSIDPEVRRLVDALQDVNAITRRDAAEALGNLGPAAAPAAEHLVAAWKDENSAVRRQSVAAVKKIGENAAASVRRDQTGPSQRAALDTVVDALIPALRDSWRRIFKISLIMARQSPCRAMTSPLHTIYLYAGTLLCTDTGRFSAATALGIVW